MRKPRMTPALLELRAQMREELARGLRMAGGHQEITDYCLALETKVAIDRGELAEKAAEATPLPTRSERTAPPEPAA